MKCKENHLDRQIVEIQKKKLNTHIERRHQGSHVFLLESLCFQFPRSACFQFYLEIDEKKILLFSNSKHKFKNVSTIPFSVFTEATGWTHFVVFYLEKQKQGSKILMNGPLKTQNHSVLRAWVWWVSLASYANWIMIKTNTEAKIQQEQT